MPAPIKKSAKKAEKMQKPTEPEAAPESAPTEAVAPSVDKVAPVAPEVPPEHTATAPTESLTEAAPAEAAPVEEPPKAPTPPPPAVPTSPPQNLVVDDVTETSLTIKWQPPETIGESGLDGYTVEYCKEGDRPRIRLPRFLRARYIKQVGDQINLVIPFIGKPKPVITWTKNGQPLDVKKVNIRNSDKDSILFIRKAERDDSGTYQMTIKVDSLEDKANIVIQIVELPGPPASVKLIDTWGFNAALEWTPPKNNGNTDITGYTVQKADKKTGEWFTVLEHFHTLNATVSDLIMGNSYSFRVFSENMVGRSESAAVTKQVATIQKTGIVYKPPEYKEHDFSEAPKFTAPLSDRAATVGYSTRLLCAVRGSPKPKIEWMKNQMLIGDDPKFRQNSNLGVCSLEIRKPCSFDGGVYTCRAKNAHGEATVACKLEVKQVIVPEDKQKK
ncbi:myosin binding protein Ha isoform X3 [Colossoma macropomum]|uniref:myosin binding protein Ha isoform X3 n=1 Tax=Colossoma macropomum TaxID=42526 RepID=UPI0018645ADF|nr:myosin binding protein Ha isoform X3 [Colossoma macropomum]